jgi:hypothetical protein
LAYELEQWPPRKPSIACAFVPPIPNELVAACGPEGIHAGDDSRGNIGFEVYSWILDLTKGFKLLK